MNNYCRDTHRVDTLPYLSTKYRPPHFQSTAFTTVKPLLCEDRPPSPTYNVRYTQELQDHVRALKDDLRRKDEIIHQFHRFDGHGPVNYRGQPEPAWYTPDRHAIDATRAADVAGLQVKVDRLQQQLKDAESDIERKEVKVKELENTVENQREGEARLTAMVQTLRERIASMESMATSYGDTSSRHEIAMSALQNENKNSHERVRELEDRLKKILQEREEMQQKFDTSEKKFADFMSQIRTLIRGDDHMSDYVPVASDTLIVKLSDIIQENAMLKSRTAMLSQNLTDTEMESKASRETIMRLVAEVGRDQKAASDMDILRVERNNAVAAKHDLEKEIELLKERLHSSQKALDATREELNHKDSRLTNIARERDEVNYSVSSSKTQYSLFLEQIAMMLSDAYHKVEPHDTAIKNRIVHLQESNKEKENNIRALEDKIKQLTADFDNQYSLHHTMASRAKHAQVDIADMELRMRSAEGELAAMDVMRDNLKRDKETYMKFLENLSDIMKMERISCDVGLDMVTDALLSRAEQLVRQESDTLTNKNTNTYNLQRKVKALKEQLQSKELHIDLLRKKITALEEKVSGKTEVEKCRDVEHVRVKKLEKMVDKYKIQLCEARNEITNFKAQLLNSSELHVENLEQRKDMTEMSAQVDELERVREKQARKIASLKQEVEQHEVTQEERRGASDNAVHALSGELKTTKNALHVTQDREKQLMDFRNVVARMLGLDVSTLAIPDYEIVTRLEKLVQSQHAFAFNTIGLGDALTDMEPNFMSGYRDAIAHESGPVRHRSRTRQRSRTRSLSPVRRDPRVY